MLPALWVSSGYAFFPHLAPFAGLSLGVEIPQEAGLQDVSAFEGWALGGDVRLRPGFVPGLRL